MGNNRKLQLAVRAVLAAAAATAVIPAAWSQTAPAVAAAPAAAADAEVGLQEVVVTGSRITSPNLVAISPITSVDAGYMASTNLSRVEDILNNLPMVFAGQNSTVSNGSNGTATVNLRGLGPSRTLVLVNNRRLGPGGDAGTNISDVNEVPAALIERIDIFTGGASSVYGADAVAGVVNFVLNTHFEGVKVDSSYSFYQHSNNNAVAQAALNAAGDVMPPSSVNTGFGKDFSVLMGSNFADNKGNATFYVTYDQSAAILEAKYDYAACVLSAVKGGGLGCAGSGTTARNGAGGYFQAYSGANGLGGSALFTNTVDGKTGAFRPFTTADEYNFGPLNFYQRPSTRWTGGSFINYQINDHVTAYGEAMFARNESDAQVAGSGIFFTGAQNLPIPVPCADPLLTADEASAICSAAAAQGSNAASLFIGRRNVEGGGRLLDVTRNTIRAVVGLKGDIIDGLTFDIYAQRDGTETMADNYNYFSNQKVSNALNVIKGPALLPSGAPNPLAGQPECNTVYTGTDTACVPYNIWVPNGVTQAALNYLSTPGLQDSSALEYVVSGSVTADMGKWNIKLPMAEEGIKLNVGSEYRSEFSSTLPDEEEQSADLEGLGGSAPPVSGGYHVGEIFTEVGIPLIDHKPLAESLGLELGYRYSDYNLGFKTNTYKFGVEYAPTSDFRLRASYSRAVRAPNIAELFFPAIVGLDGSTDPCAGPTPKGTQAQCLLAGVSAAQYGHIGANSASQYNGLTGGNPNLQPEKSDTYTAGLVITPSFLHNFSASFDYFNIKLQDTIGSIGGDTIINNCIATGDPVFCNAVHRDSNGSLFKTLQGYVTDVNVNFGELTTRGIDAKFNYRLPLTTLGSLLFNLEGTRLMNLGKEPLTGGPAYDCAGYFGTTCGAPNSKWRHVFNTTWSTPWNALDLTARWRFLSGADSEQISQNPALAGPVLPLTQHIKPYSYFDLSADMALYKMFKLQFGVNNVLDKDPPIIASSGGGFASDCPTITTNGSSCNGNTFPGTYDSLGRFFFARITAQF
jgi:outer membrane receptor protein involved in Fe transport